MLGLVVASLRAKGESMIDGNTVVSLTMKQLLGTVVAAILLLCGGLWAVLSITTGGLRDDVSSIRQSAQSLSAADKETAIRLRESENKLIEQIAGLRTDIATFSVRIESVNSNIAGMNRRMDEMQRQIASRAAALNDPKAFDTFIMRVKDAAGAQAGDNKLIVVPFEPLLQPK